VKKAAKKSGRGKNRPAEKSAATEPVNLQELRERVRRLVANQAEKMTNAAAEEAAKGHVAQLKYLFEVIGLYPVAEAANAEPVDSDDLAKALLAKFEFPHTLPVDVDEEDEEKAVPAGSGSDSVE
jgi:hypothetical protein